MPTMFRNNDLTSCSFGPPIPPNTTVPSWAYLDVARSDNFNVTAAQDWASQNHPDTSALLPSDTSSLEIRTSARPNLSSVTYSSRTPFSFTLPPFSSSGSPTPTDTASFLPPSSISHPEPDHRKHTGPVIGGVVGAVFGVSAVLAAVGLWLRRRQRHTPPSFEFTRGRSEVVPPRFRALSALQVCAGACSHALWTIVDVFNSLLQFHASVRPNHQTAALKCLNGATSTKRRR